MLLPASRASVLPMVLLLTLSKLISGSSALSRSVDAPLLPETLSGIPQSVVSLITRFWEIFGPGGRFHPESFIESKGHLVVEGVLVLAILYLFLQKSFNPSFQKQLQTELTEQVGSKQSCWNRQPMHMLSNQTGSRYLHLTHKLWLTGN